MTYTVIDVPLQKKSKTGTKYRVLFHFNNKYNLSLPMTPGTSIILLGKLLIHRQSCNAYKPTDDHIIGQCLP